MATLNKKFAAYYLIIFLAIAIYSNGQNRFVLEGTIGKYPIVMLVNEFETNLDVTYFYKKYRHDIRLSGEKNIHGIYTFSKRKIGSKPEGDVLEEFRICLDKNNEWKGTWRNQKAVVLPVSLKKINPFDYHFQEIPDMDFGNLESQVYTKARLAGIEFHKNSITSYGTYSLGWVTEPITKIKSFRIIKGFPDTLLKKINNVLTQKHFLDIESYYECEGRGENDGVYETTIHGYFISPDYISIQKNVFWICAPAHPGEGDNSFTIDAIKGTEIKYLDDLAWFTGKKPPPVTSDAYLNNYTVARGKALAAILTKLYPNEMRKQDTNDPCDYSRSVYWEFPSWYFTDKGLYIGPNFPHVTSSACNSPVFSIIPYTILKQYLASEK